MVGPANTPNAKLQIKPVNGRRDLERFIRVPWLLYQGDPAWVPPLLMERRMHLASGNPYFQHAKYRSWIAYRGTEAVGRISAQIDRLHLERYQDATGFFGMIESEDNPETFQALLNTAETWLHGQGMRRILGPFNLSINQECGLLVEGFDTPPYLMMGHALPYYGPQIEALGYAPEQDMLAYFGNIETGEFKLSSAMRSMVKRASKVVKIRHLGKSTFEQDLEAIRDIYNDAWSDNWGFIPFTEAEFKHLGKDLKLLVPSDFVAIAEIDGTPEAMMVGFPNLNEVIYDINGRLLPIGWLKLLWRLKVSFPKSGRCPLMGVRRRHHNSRMGAALALMIMDNLMKAGIRRGLRQMELSWILEDNQGMRNMLESMGARVYKRYRIYSKALN
jgi:hypothetical protein